MSDQRQLRPSAIPAVVDAKRKGKGEEKQEVPTEPVTLRYLEYKNRRRNR